MSISVETRGETGRVILEGVLSFECHAAFRAATGPLLADPGLRRIRLDLAGVERMDASCLGMLLLLREKADARGLELEVATLSEGARSLLESAGFAGLFRIAK